MKQPEFKKERKKYLVYLLLISKGVPTLFIIYMDRISMPSQGAGGTPGLLHLQHVLGRLAAEMRIGTSKIERRRREDLDTSDRRVM